MHRLWAVWNVDEIYVVLIISYFFTLIYYQYLMLVELYGVISCLFLYINTCKDRVNDFVRNGPSVSFGTNIILIYVWAVKSELDPIWKGIFPPFKVGLNLLSSCPIS